MCKCARTRREKDLEQIRGLSQETKMASCLNDIVCVCVCVCMCVGEGG